LWGISLYVFDSRKASRNFFGIRRLLPQRKLLSLPEESQRWTAVVP